MLGELQNIKTVHYNRQEFATYLFECTAESAEITWVYWNDEQEVGDSAVKCLFINNCSFLLRHTNQCFLYPHLLRDHF